MGIRRLFIVMLVCFSLLPMLLMGYVVITTVSQTVEKTFIDNLVNAVSLEAENLDNFFSTRVGATGVLQKAPFVEELLLYNDPSSPNTNSRAYMENEIKNYFTQRADSEDFVTSILLVDKYGDIVCNTLGEDTYRHVRVEELLPEYRGQEFYISGIRQDSRVFNGEKFFYISCPVLRAGEFLGYTVQFLNMKTFDVIRNHQGIYTQAYLFLVDPEGVFAATGNISLAQYSVNDMEFGESFAAQFYSCDFAAKPDGFIEYTIDGENRVSYYKVIPASGWILFSSIARDEVYVSRVALLRVFCAAFLILFLVTLTSSFFVSRWAMSPIAGIIHTVEKIQEGDYTKRFASVGITEFVRITTVFNQLMDGIEMKTSELERQAEELRQSNERYRIITDHTKEIIFEWDFQTDKADYSFTWWKKFGYDPVMNNVSVDFKNADYIHSDDRGVFVGWIDKIFRKPNNSREEFRIRTIDNEYYWVRICTIPIFDQNNQPIKLVGLIQDIDETKRKELELMNRADFDYLSQLYNRAAFEGRITSVLEDGQPVSLMYIDIDDFRIFNTKYGHAFGDQIIRFIGEKITACIENDGFAGRVGGDEFVICVTNPETSSSIDKLAVKLMKLLREGLYISETDDRARISCSIGIVSAPENGTTWSVLSECADKAMYEVKHSGKSNFSIASLKHPLNTPDKDAASDSSAPA